MFFVLCRCGQRSFDWQNEHKQSAQMYICFKLQSEVKMASSANCLKTKDNQHTSIKQ